MTVAVVARVTVAVVGGTVPVVAPVVATVALVAVARVTVAVVTVAPVVAVVAVVLRARVRGQKQPEPGRNRQVTQTR